MDLSIHKGAISLNPVDPQTSLWRPQKSLHRQLCLETQIQPSTLGSESAGPKSVDKEEGPVLN